MRSLVLSVDDAVYERLVNFLRILPQNKVRILEDTLSAEDLERELHERKQEIARGEVLSHSEFWEDAGI